MKIDLNSDLGESYGPWRMGRDDEMLDIVTSANVACGMHAGDPAEMARIVAMCKAKSVGIGAHPGFDDLHGFGRREIIGNSDAEMMALVSYQIGALMGIAGAGGAQLRHVKLHGALSNMAARDPRLARLFVAAVQATAPELLVMAVAATEIQKAAETADAPFVCEVFADRTYTDIGTLTPRSEPGAVIHDADVAAEHVLRMVDEQAVTSTNGVKTPVKVDTICVHGDNPQAVALAAKVRERLEKAGIEVAAF
jgi:5-oxoprolinase (ATP-hydrolysing) subunit A